MMNYIRKVTFYTEYIYRIEVRKIAQTIILGIGNIER